MKINKIIIFLTILVFSTINLFSQNKISLKDAIKIVLEKNYDIKIAKSEFEISKNNFSIGNAGFLPSLDLTGKFNNANLNVSQEYLDGRKVERDGAKSSNC